MYIGSHVASYSDILCLMPCVNLSWRSSALWNASHDISNISLVPCLSSIAYISTLELEHGETLAASYKVSYYRDNCQTGI